MPTFRCISPSSAMTGITTTHSLLLLTVLHVLKAFNIYLGRTHGVHQISATIKFLLALEAAALPTTRALLLMVAAGAARTRPAPMEVLMVAQTEALVARAALVVPAVPVLVVLVAPAPAQAQAPMVVLAVPEVPAPAQAPAPMVVPTAAPMEALEVPALTQAQAPMVVPVPPALKVLTLALSLLVVLASK